MTPATHDFTVVRGTSADQRDYSPLIMKFTKNGVPIIYDDVRLSIFKKAANELKGMEVLRAELNSGLTVTDTDTGEVSWLPTAEDTRKLELGDNYYEVELVIGTSEVVFLMGTITGIGGLNDDGAATS